MNRAGFHLSAWTAFAQRRPALLASAIAIILGIVLGFVPAGESTKLLLLVLGVGLLIVALFYPRIILWLLLGLTVCLSETRFGVVDESVFRLGSYVLDPIRLNTYELLTYSLLLVLIIRRLLGTSGIRLPRSVGIPSIVFAVILGLQLLRALMSGTSYALAIHPFNGRYALTGVAAVWCFAQLLDGAKTRLRTLDVLFVLATARALYSLFGYFFGAGEAANAYRDLGVKVAVWESADHMLFVFLLVVAVAGWATGRISRSRLLFWLPASGILAVTIILSFRRTGWLGLVAALLVVVLLLFGRSRRVLALLPGLGGAVAAVLALSYRRFSSSGGLFSRLFPDLVSSQGSRQGEWELAWQTILRNPVVGDLTARRGSGIYYWDTRIVHNGILFVWMKFGLFGLLALAATALACLRYAYRGFRSLSREDYVALGTLALVPFVFLYTMTEAPMIEARTMLVLALVGSFGLLIGMQDPQSRPGPDAGGADAGTAYRPGVSDDRRA